MPLPACRWAAIASVPTWPPPYGVPTFIKDNTDVRGLHAGHGGCAFAARPARTDGRYARQYLSTGMTLLGKSRLPELQ